MRRGAALVVAVALAACDGSSPGPAAPGARLAVDPADPGPAELPGDPLPEPFPWTAAALAGVAAAAASAWLLHRAHARRSLRQEPAAPPPVAAGPLPHERALERIQRLRARRPADRSETDAFYVEASSVVRGYVGERFGLPTGQMTSEQCVESSRGAVDPPAHEGLAALLRHCDEVKFALHAPADAERESMLDSAAAFVRQTASPAAEPRP